MTPPGSNTTGARITATQAICHSACPDPGRGGVAAHVRQVRPRDRVAFVQGAVRFQTIVFGLTSRSDHSRAVLLATHAHDAAVAGALTPLDR